jgi:cell division protein FtsL
MQSVLKANSFHKKNTFRQQLLWVFLLWVAVLVSALAVIYSAHDTRNKFSALEVLRVQQNALQVDWGKYLLEESAYASFGRVEKIATEKLLMTVPTIKQVVVVNIHE